MFAARQIAFGSRKRLPYDAEIEYLESTGTQWINTGINCGSLDFQIEMETPNMVPAGWVHQNDGNGTWIALQTIAENDDGAIWYGKFSDVYNTKNIFDDSTIHNIVYNSKHGLYIDGVLKKEFSISSIKDSINNISLPLFGWYDFNISEYTAYETPTPKLYFCKINVNSNLVRDFIPVRVGNVGYLYDKVSGKLFGNMGTGDFVLGPDLIESTANEYIQDGLIAMYDGIENAGFGKHDDNVTTWINLGSLGNNYNATRLIGSFTNNGAKFNGLNITDETFSIPNYFMANQMKGEWSYEIIFTPYNWETNYAGLWGNHGSTKGIVGGQYENGIISFNLYQPNVQLYTVEASQFIPNKIYSVVQTASNTSQTSMTFLNGTQQSYKSNVDVLLNFNDDERTCIGAAWRSQAADVEGTNRSFNGVIHSLRIYNRMIDITEIQHNYEIDKRRFGL